MLILRCNQTLPWVQQDTMESPVVNLYNQFQSLRAQVDCLNEGIEPRELFSQPVAVFCLSVKLGGTI